MANNKVELSDGSVLIDLSQDTVTSSDHIMSGYVGHLASGLQVTGTGNNYVMSDWNAEEVTDSESGEITGYEDGYILNKPAIKAGEGENSIVEGMIEDDDYSKIYTLYLTGEAGATTFTYTTEDEITESANNITWYGIIYNPSGTQVLYTTSRIESIDLQNLTITLTNIITNKSKALENQQVFLYYLTKNTAIKLYSHVEGMYNLSTYGYTHVEGARNLASGSYSHVEGYNNTSILQYGHAEGYKTRAAGVASHTEGTRTVTTGSYSHAEGSSTTASGKHSHSEGHCTNASNTASHAEGGNTSASGSHSHAEGNFTLASGFASHAEGNVVYILMKLTGEPNATIYNFNQSYTSQVILLLKMAHTKIISNTNYDNFNLNTSFYSTITNIDFDNSTITVDTTLSDTAISDVQYYIYIRTEASGKSSHAEGTSSLASGEDSHAEGNETVASGNNSHASGELTTAATRTQTVIGTYNIPDDTTTNLHPSQYSGFGKYAFVVGNGYDIGGASNAHTLDWQGNGWYAGKLTVGSNPTGNMDVATKQYVDNHVPDLSGYVATSNLATLVNPLIQAALAEYGDGDTATYGTTS